jgi:molybdopterin-guanine dinucleotide biosynthesis protein A
MPALSFTGVILAGGQSSRMGQPKEGILLRDGRPMMTHVLGALQAVCEQIAVVGECRGFAVTEGILHLPDRHPGLGPMAGLETILASGLDERYLIITCDQPALTPALLGQLLAEASPGSVAVFDTDPLSPFPGCYPSEWLTRVTKAIAQEEYSPRRLLEADLALRKVALPADESWRVQSVNIPAELNQLEQKLAAWGLPIRTEV